MAPRMLDPLTIWTVSDAKPGHANQLRALVAGIERRTAVVAHPLACADSNALTGRFPRAMTADLPAPDLILCAGRTTHRPARAVKKQFGGRLVVCMRPSARAAAFDLCLVPRHDDPAPAPTIEPTAGAIVNVRPSDAHDDARGVILIGGDSKHHRTDADATSSAVRAIVARDVSIAWDLTTSRRTSDALADQLSAIDASNLTITPPAQTPPGWVGEQLARAGRAWVTEDSVSMLCEAVTAGCATGVLPMIRTSAHGRVYRCVDDFTGELALATPYDAWRAGATLAAPASPLDEADRCAGIILDRFFPEPERRA